MKKLLIFLILVLPLTCSLCACSSDEEEDDEETVVIYEDGTTSNKSVFLLIDDDNFYLDYVKYSINFNGNLMVTGYSEWRARGIANIAPKISFKGHTYNVTYIAGEAFKNCEGLTSVTIPPTIHEIGEKAFQNCTGLTSLYIPRSVNLIGYLAFDYCSNLKRISVEEGNEKYYSPDNCNAIIEKGRKNLIQGCESTIIPDDVFWIFHESFHGCKNMTSITIPQNVSYIGQNAFKGCSRLTSIHCQMKESVLAISQCIPNAFDEEQYSSATLYVPKGSREAYMNKSPWKQFKNIVEE